MTRDLVPSTPDAYAPLNPELLEKAAGWHDNEARKWMDGTRNQAEHVAYAFAIRNAVLCHAELSERFLGQAVELHVALAKRTDTDALDPSALARIRCAIAAHPRFDAIPIDRDVLDDLLRPAANDGEEGQCLR